MPLRPAGPPRSLLGAVPRSGGPQRAPGLGRLLEGGKRILPEEKRGPRRPREWTRGRADLSWAGFRAALAGPRAFCLGRRCWGVGDDKEDLPGRSGGWQRRKGVSQCGTAGDARVGQTENFRRWALLYCGARRSGWRLESTSTGNGEPALLAGIGSVTTRGKSLPFPLKSLPSLCPSPSYGPSSPRPSPGPGVGRLSDPGHCCAFPAPPTLPRPVTPASPRGPLCPGT